MITGACIQIKLIESADPDAGNTWVTVVPIEECSPTGIRVAVEDASRLFLESQARDLIQVP